MNLTCSCQIKQEIHISDWKYPYLYILMRICNKHYSFPSAVSLTAALMCFIHFKMLINTQVMPQMYIFLTGNLPCCHASAGSNK